jgi:hypothetical protein
VYEDYAIIPLDVGRAPVDAEALKAFVQRNCERCAFTANAIRYVLFFARKPVIDGELLLHACDPRFEDLTDAAGYAWDPVFQREFPELCTWVEELPLRVLFGVDLVTQTADIRDHLDVFGHNNSESYFREFRHIEPIYYRAIISDPGDNVARSRCFYVTREHGGERRYVNLPDGTDAFAMSSSICYHGAEFHAGHFKTTVVIYGEHDVERHLALLDRSLERYGDHAIRFEAAGPVGGPGAVLPYAGARL